MSSAPWTPLDESIGRLNTLVSPYTGIVRRVYDVLRGPTDARLVRIGSETAEGSELVGSDIGPIREGSGGSNAVPSAAVAAAIAETAERYSACYQPEEELVLATAAELGPEAVDPERFALFHASQYERSGFPFVPFDAHTPTRWARAFSLPDRRAAWLPVQLVYLGWRDALTGEDRVGYATSNGLACGPTLQEAIVSALLEALERDAFMITWNDRLSLPLLDWSGDPDLVSYAERHFEGTGLAYAAVDLSCFWGVPTVLGVVRGSPEAALGVGAGAAATIGGAWRKALAEAFAVRAWARVQRLGQDTEREFRDDFSDVLEFSDHVEFYGAPERARHADFLDASRARRSTTAVESLGAANPDELLAALTERLRGEGLTAYAVDVTSPDVRDAGLAVAKVIVPELCQLDVAHRARYLGGRRLYEAAAALGLVDRPLALADLNPYPHPFP